MNGVKTEILPEPGKRNVLITSALPYVNNVPHLGNIIGSVLSADVFARYCKARGDPTIYICGTDEYGTATEAKAIEEKLTPQELCTKYHKIHKEVYDWFEIEFDHFGRTPTQEQTDIAQDIFTKLHGNGYLEEEETTQPYCESHNGFLADRFVEGECPRCGFDDARGDQCDKCGRLLDPLELKNPRCKLDGATPVARKTKHIFILLDKLQNKVAEWSKKADSSGHWSENGISITNAWLKEGLRPRAITRDLKWGTAVPLEGYDDKVLYVWFDACIGYVSITATYTKHWELWWRNPENVSLYQFMGKDNVPFHTVVFPSSQLGTGDKWTMLNHLSTAEYLKYEGGKFSKSRNVGVFGDNAKQTGVDADVWRYFLLLRRPEVSDTEFEWDSFIAANNSELVANFGNLVNRVLKFVNSANYNSVVPERPNLDQPHSIAKVLTSHLQEANEILKRYTKEMDAVHLKQGLIIAREFSSLGNKLLADSKLDNSLFNLNRAACDAVVNLAVNHIHLLASLIAPYLPATTKAILKQLQATQLIIPESWKADSIPAGHQIGKAAHLFKMIKPEKAQEWRGLFGGVQSKEKKSTGQKEHAQKDAERRRKAAKAQDPAVKTTDRELGEVSSSLKEYTLGDSSVSQKS